MGLRDEVEANDLAIGRPDTFARLLRDLGDEADEFLGLLHDSDVYCSAIGRALRARGLTVSNGTLRSWRRDGRR